MAGFCKMILSDKLDLDAKVHGSVAQVCVSVEAEVAAEVAELGEVKTRFQGREGSCDSSKSVQDMCGGGRRSAGWHLWESYIFPAENKSGIDKRLPTTPGVLTPCEGCESLKMWLSPLYMVTDLGKGLHYFVGGD